MAENQVVKILKEIIGDDYKDCLMGEIKFENGKCDLEERGGVYGFAVDLTSVSESERRSIFDKSDKRHKCDFENWKSIGDNYYPLYWGKDSNLGSRLLEHVKNSWSVESLQLNKREELHDKKVIYGAVFCKNALVNETKIRREFPDIYQNKIDEKKQGN